MLRFIFFLSIVFSFQFVEAQKYLEMMDDISVNFYDVCKEAERYFNSIDKNKKGSGFKAFMRWKNNTEYMYYPSGNRINIDPYHTAKASKRFLKKYPELSSSLGERSITFGWQELGPNQVAKVSGHYSAGIGRIEDIYVNPSNENLIYISSRSGGFWKTTDGGNTWSGNSTDFLPATGVNTLTGKPDNPNHILINLRNARNGYSHGVYRSTDGGTTFNESLFNPQTLGFGGFGSYFIIHKVAYHPLKNNVVFVLTSKGVYKSKDNLATWTKVSDNQCKFIAFHPTNASYLYLSGHSNLYVMRSLDEGETFSNSTAIPNNNTSTARLSVTSAKPNLVFISSNDGIWKSTDMGLNFSFISNPNVGSTAFLVNDADESNILTGYVDLYSSNDNGNTFNQKTEWNLKDTNFHPYAEPKLFDNYEESTAYVHADTRVAKSVNGNFYVGTDGFVAKSTDGGNTWVNIMKKGVAVRENYKLGVSQSNNSVTMCGSQDNGTSIINAEGWLEFYGADGMEAIIHPLNPNYMIGSVQYGTRIRTKNGGISHDNVTVPNNDEKGDWQSPILFDPNNPMTIYDFRLGIKRSDNFATDYVHVGDPLFDNKIMHAEIAQNNSQILVISRHSNIEKSVDGGATFVSIKNNLPNGSIQDIAFDPKNDNTFFVVYATYQNDGNKIFKTTDGGNNWTNISYNIDDIPVHSIVIDQTDNQYIYIGTEIGVFTMPLNGTLWSSYSTNLPKVCVEELEINHGANTIKAATWGRGLWENNLKNRQYYPVIKNIYTTNPPIDNLPNNFNKEHVMAEIDYEGVLSGVKVIWSTDIPDFKFEIDMVNNKDNLWVTQTPIPEFDANTKVYFKVIATGANNEVSETYKFMYKVQEYKLCDSKGTDNTTSDYINKVTINDFENSSEKNGYTFYDNLDPITLYMSKTQNLSIQMNYAFPDDEPGAWIDFNGNATIDDNETIDMGVFENNIASAYFDIPDNAITDRPIILRVRSSYFNDPQPCQDDAGEVEDYLVVIENDRLSIKNPTQKSIKFYPNPVNEVLSIETDRNDLTYHIYNLMGAHILSTDSKSINVSHLNKGIYIIKSVSNETHYVGRFIKN